MPKACQMSSFFWDLEGVLQAGSKYAAVAAIYATQPTTTHSATICCNTGVGERIPPAQYMCTAVSARIECPVPCRHVVDIVVHDSTQPPMRVIEGEVMHDDVTTTILLSQHDTLALHRGLILVCRRG